MDMDTLYEILETKKFVIAGPCVIEDEKTVMEIAGEAKRLCEERGLFYIFKASFDKANRTSVASFRGPDIEKGLEMLAKVKERFNVPVTTDVHESWQPKKIAKVVDIIQIPAFLCRQTDLLTAAAKTDRIVNIKKAQFLSAADMAHPVEKVRKAGNDRIMLTERGTTFGYNNLVVDFRNLAEMAELDVPVIMDVTHSTQRPGGLGGRSGGDSKFAPLMAAASAAVGVNGHFFEVHPDPSKALSDGPNMIPLADFGSVLDLTVYHGKMSAIKK